METFNVLVDALGLILGSFVAAIGLSAAAWTVFVRTNHPEWGTLAIMLALMLALATRLVRGEFLTMVAILLAIAAPLMWVEGRAWRCRKSRGSRGPGFIRRKC